MSLQSDGKKKDKKNGKAAALIRSSGFQSVLILIGASLVIFALYCTVCAPKQYDLSVGSIAHETINATKDVVDEVTTEEKRQAAAAAVEPTYRFQEGVKEEVLNTLSTVFGEMRTVQQYAATLQTTPDTRVTSFSDTEIEYAMGLVTSMTLSRYQISTLLRTSSERFEEMVTLVTTAVENSLNNTIREGQVTQAIQTILQIVGYKLDVSLTQNIVPSVLRVCLRPNMIVEQETTEIARQAARDNVEPVVYLQGQNIIRQGEKVNRSQLTMLRSLGLLKDNIYDFSIYAGALVVVVLAMLSFGLSLRMLCKQIFTDVRKMGLTMIVLVLGLVISVVSHLYFSAYMVPAVFVPLLLTVLLGAETGYAAIAPYAILIAGIAAGNSNSYLYEMILLMLMSLSGSIVSVRIMSGHPQRVRILVAAAVSSTVSAFMIFAVSWMTTSDTFSPYANVAWGMGGAIFSGVLAIAFQPLFESLFHLATPTRLQELCNPNQPMLRRLLLEAPGTYHHSIIVANLSEAAAAKIGANPYLARAAATYHDIGKLKRPMYFKENQIGENPHDGIDPYVSAAILTSHARDGYQMALKEKLPREIANIILQHHGDTPVMFFYHKALQLSNGTPVDINEFRYEGPRPNTREAAIIMLADTIEAAVRSMKDPTPKSINQFIERLLRGKLEDGQLSDSPITLRDIDDICEAFSTVLMGVFHERIEYPEVKHRVPASVPAAAGTENTSASAAAPAETGNSPGPSQSGNTAAPSPDNAAVPTDGTGKENSAEVTPAVSGEEDFS